MITLPDALTAEHVILNLASPSPAEAIGTVAALLQNDPRVLDWEEFYAVLLQHPSCQVACPGGTGLCIPHARTTAVSEVVISAARLSPELAFPDLVDPVRYIFCIGVPQTLAADYLRLVGVLLRLLKEPKTEAALRAVTTRQAFVEALARFEMKL